MQKTENPGLAPRALHDLSRSLNTHHFTTLLDLQAQLLARRFGLATGIARTAAQHCYGEGRHD